MTKEKTHISIYCFSSLNYYFFVHLVNNFISIVIIQITILTSLARNIERSERFHNENISYIICPTT